MHLYKKTTLIQINLIRDQPMSSKRKVSKWKKEIDPKWIDLEIN